jgi:hypothetical protein
VIVVSDGTVTARYEERSVESLPFPLG